MKILVTGGAGYIGSHTVLELLASGHEVVIADNFVNSSPEAVRRVSKLADQEVVLEEVDLCDREALKAVFERHTFDAVIHFAGLKAVGGSVSQPLRYYRNNLVSTLNLCELMGEFGVKKLIFSSSATVYALVKEMPITEAAQTGATNPYGHTKHMIEQILQDLVVSDPEWSITLLRYFNPVGAHPSGEIGEDPNGLPNNLLPFVAQVAVGKLEKVRVFGDDYDTPDGTGVRDYIHVLDLASGHVAALEHLPKAGVCEVYNLGSGHGYSVLEAIEAFKKASGNPIPYEVVERRPGDIATCYADPSKAEKELGWKAKYTLDEACRDAWKWQSQNPNGFKD